MTKTNKNGWMHGAAVLLGLAAVLALVAWGMHIGRRSALQLYQGETAREDWEQWRRDAKLQSEGEGPVLRRMPSSTEPPALVLMRDYYWECLVGAWVVTAAVALSIYLLLRGMFRSPTWQPLEDPVHPSLQPAKRIDASPDSAEQP